MEETQPYGISPSSLNDRHAILLDHIPHPVWLKDEMRRYVYVNRSFLDFYGLLLENVLFRDDDGIFPPDLSSDYRVKEDLVAAKKEALRTLDVALTGDGLRIAVETTRTPVLDHGGKIVATTGFVQHTGSGKAEEAIRQAEEKYRNIFENAIEGIFQIDPDGRIVSANPALARILGYDSPQDLMATVTNMDGQIHVSEKRRREYNELLETKGLVRDFETQVSCKDGRLNWVSVNSRRVTDSRGNLLYDEGTMESITERKKLEAQLRNAQKMESIGTLAGGVAHDFNNILTTIMGYCSLIMMKAGKGNPLLGYVEQIMEAANRASTLTHSLLSFSRKQVTETKAIEVNENIRGVEKLLRRIIGEDIELRTALSAKQLVVLVGDGQIGQVLMNIATNARDAMPDGGALTIKTE